MSRVSPTKKCWYEMHYRCYKTWNADYSNYGGRGIKVCERWHTYENFKADMGEKPYGLSLGRANNDGDYTPENCSWETPEEQNNNRRERRLGYIRSDSSTGISGVNWDNRRGGWIVYIKRNGVRKTLYTGYDLFEACCRRKSAELVV